MLNPEHCPDYLYDEVLLPFPSPGSMRRVVNKLMEVSAVGTAGGTALTKLGTLALCGIGFTEVGVAAKSWASSYMSYAGPIKAGSWYAAFQSIGAKGGFALFDPYWGTAVVVTGLGYVGYQRYKARAARLAGIRELERNWQTWGNPMPMRNVIYI